MKPSEHDVVVIGAGPAGIGAAVTAARHGASVLLLDEGMAPGGQIYRNVEGTSPKLLTILGRDYARGQAVVADLSSAKVLYRPQSSVWRLEPSGTVGFTAHGISQVAEGKRIIIATGSIERPFPVEGWDLPGVMTVGAAQTMLKASGMLADSAVLVGSGPLVWLLADQYRRAGRPPLAVIDTAPPIRLRSLLPIMHRFLLSPYAPKGLRLLLNVRKSVPVYSGASKVKLVDEQGKFRVSFRHASTDRSILTEHVFLHQGIVPHVNLASAVGCALAWNDDQACWNVAVDDWGRTSVRNVFVAGDGASIAGAEAAHARGTLAALSCLHGIGLLDHQARDAAAAPVRSTLRRYLAGRQFIDRLYRPASASMLGTPTTTACRCEDISIGAVREACAMLKPNGINQMKALLRCGMGPCQGRFCASTISEFIAESRDVSAAEIAPYRYRFPVKPLSVGELALGVYSRADEEAVARD